MNTKIQEGYNVKGERSTVIIEGDKTVILVYTATKPNYTKEMDTVSFDKAFEILSENGASFAVLHIAAFMDHDQYVRISYEEEREGTYMYIHCLRGHVKLLVKE